MEEAAYISLPWSACSEAASQREILKEFNGDNYRQLSRKYSIPVRSLQIMVEKGRNV